MGDIYIYIYIHMVSILGIVIMVLGICSVFGYLDTWGNDSVTLQAASRPYAGPFCGRPCNERPSYSGSG